MKIIKYLLKESFDMVLTASWFLVGALGLVLFFTFEPWRMFMGMVLVFVAYCISLYQDEWKNRG